MREQLEKLGYQVKDINNGGYQFRINEAIDIYPKKKKYFDLITKEWGIYEDYKTFLKSHINNTPQPVDDIKKIKVEKILQNVEKRLMSKKILSRPRQILAEEIIKYL